MAKGDVWCKQINLIMYVRVWPIRDVGASVKANMGPVLPPLYNADIAPQKPFNAFLMALLGSSQHNPSPCHAYVATSA